MTKRLQKSDIFSAVTTIFFDVSDTLYSSAKMENEYPRVLTQLIADMKDISFEEAKKLIKEITAKLQETDLENSDAYIAKISELLLLI